MKKILTGYVWLLAIAILVIGMAFYMHGSVGKTVKNKDMYRRNGIVLMSISVIIGLYLHFKEHEM